MAMASPLDTIKSAIASGMRGKLRSGTLWRRGTAAGVDSLGDAVPGAASSFSFEGIRSNYDAAYRVAAGIPETDAKILIIAGSTTATPTRDDVIYIDGEWWQVRDWKQDPAGATYACQSFQIAQPSWAA